MKTIFTTRYNVVWENNTYIMTFTVYVLDNFNVCIMCFHTSLITTV
jgi:hypothetical protein